MIEGKHRHKCHKIFRNNIYRSKRLQPWLKRYQNPNLQPIYDDNVAAVLESQGYSVQSNPRSVLDVDKLFEALEGYAPGKVKNPKPSRYYDNGISLAYACFARPKSIECLQPLDFTPETLVKITSKMKSSAGLTNFGHTKAESLTRALERGLQTINRVKKPEPCLCFARTQFNDKTRLVWGYPYSMTGIEGLFARPLIDRFKEAPGVMAFSQTTLTLGSRIRIASYHKEWAYSLDMSQYDAHVSEQLIRKAFKILSTWFDLNQIEPASGEKYSNIWKLIVDYFIHTTIVMPDGHIYYGKDHGVPSGSYFTQMVDSIVNVILLGAASSRFDLHVDREDIFVLGDDILFFSNRRMDLNNLSRFINHDFSVLVHGSEKSEIVRYDQPIRFLGRTWINGIPDMPVQDIIDRLVNPERFRKRSKDPDRAASEVFFMFVCMATQYKEAFRILRKCYGFQNPHARTVSLYALYCGNLNLSDIDPSYLSGLMSYLLQYHWSDEDKKDWYVLNFLK